jgi:hypothetical protein
MDSTERTNLLSFYGRAIAGALNALVPLRPWTFVEPTENTYSVYLRNAGKARIYLQFDGYEKPTRIIISGYLHIGKNGQYVEVYEKSADGTRWNRCSVPSITVTVAKNPEAIAKDIVRRFLPEYLRVLALAEDKLVEDAAYEAKIAANLQRLAWATGTLLTDCDRHEARKNFTWKLHNNYHTVTASENDCSLTLDNLTIEQAEKIIGILKGGKQ